MSQASNRDSRISSETTPPFLCAKCIDRNAVPRSPQSLIYLAAISTLNTSPKKEESVAEISRCLERTHSNGTNFLFAHIERETRTTEQSFSEPERPWYLLCSQTIVTGAEILHELKNPPLLPDACTTLNRYHPICCSYGRPGTCASCKWIIIGDHKTAWFHLKNCLCLFK